MKKHILTQLTILLILFSLVSVRSQQISGTVTTETNEPLPGANVFEQGTTNGVTSDFDGNYTIDVSGPDAVLVYTYIGFATQELPVGSSTTMNVSLAEDSQGLDEVVVVGYGTQRRKDLTGAVVSADLESFQEAPNTSVLQSLSGSVAGLNIGQTSTAGAEPTIQVRGQTSINGNQDPLVVLDGIIYRGRVSDLNPKDIESIDILRDVSSKAIYGAQAANGVLIVSTKKGRKGQKPSINYSTFYSLQDPANQLNRLDREGYLQAARAVDYQNAFLAPDFTQPNPDYSLRNNVPFNTPLLEGLENGTDFDWLEEVTSSPFIVDHQISFRGSTEKTSYFISGGYTDQEGWVLNDSYNRKTARINIDTEITDWLTIGANTFGSFTDRSGESPELDGLALLSPLATPRDENGEFIINPQGDLRLNPYLVASSDDEDKLNNISGVFFAKVDFPFIEGLSYQVNYSNNYRWTLLGNSNEFGAGLTGSASKENASTLDVALDNIFTYDRRFGEDHGFKFTFVAGINEINYEQTSASGTGFSNLDLSYNNLGLAVIQNISSEAWKESYASQTGRLNYDYKRKYFLTATLRRDGFSGFSQDNKIGYFPSVGVSWNIANEEFLADSETLNFLKLRASYGASGNLTGRYSSLARVNSPNGSRYVFGDGGTTVNGKTVVSLANNDLTWEKTTGLNLGLDFGLFQSRVSGSIDYYNSTTTDLLYDFVLPEITGFSTIRSNIGEIQNNGLEVILNVNPVQTDDFNWDVAFNFATNTNEINSLIGVDADGDGVEDDLTANGLFIGESIGSVYTYETDGLWQIADGDNIPDGYAPGLPKIVDQNNDGEIRPEDDRVIIGRTEPGYTFGIQNTFRYKGLALRVFVKGIQGGSDGYLGLNNAQLQNTPGNAQNLNWYREIDYWSPSNPNATYGLPGLEGAINPDRYFDRSFIRLQDISLSYNLDQRVLDKIGIQSLKFFLSGKNLLTITDWEGWDPETGQGLSYFGNALPVLKGITLGLDVSF